MEGTFQMMANKCYSVVAAGVPPVGEVNLQIVSTLIPMMAPVLAVDSDSGPQAIIGRKPSCYKALPPGGPAKMIVTVAGGSGLVAAQVFEK